MKRSEVDLNSKIREISHPLLWSLQPNTPRWGDGKYYPPSSTNLRISGRSEVGEAAIESSRRVYFKRIFKVSRFPHKSVKIAAIFDIENGKTRRFSTYRLKMLHIYSSISVPSCVLSFCGISKKIKKYYFANVHAKKIMQHAKSKITV